jgi:type IX secretion system PorP/SprF family membrane protein
MRCFFSILTILVLTAKIQAQDIHFSQFYDSPLNLNPALTGDFEGSYRFVGNFRRQWASISPNPYRSTSFSVDAHDFLKSRNLGLGILLFQDIAGDSRFQQLQGGISLAYKLRLSKDSAHSLSIGPRIYMNQFSLSYIDLRYGDQFNGNSYDPSLPTSDAIGLLALKSLDMALGFQYAYNNGQGQQLKIGMAVDNFFQPRMVFLSGGQSHISRRYTAHAQMVFPFRPNWYAEPFGLYMRQGEYQQLNIGSTVRYDMDPRKYNYRAVFAGASTRVGDAANLTAGLYYGAWKFGLSYDINYSKLTAASNYRGGAEIAVIYIMPAMLPKRVKYKYCPDYL